MSALASDGNRAHTFSTRIVSRILRNAWSATCSCGDAWTGSTYDDVEDSWIVHVHEATGRRPKPMGRGPVASG